MSAFIVTIFILTLISFLSNLAEIPRWKAGNFIALIIQVSLSVWAGWLLWGAA